MVSQPTRDLDFFQSLDELTIEQSPAPDATPKPVTLDRSSAVPPKRSRGSDVMESGRGKRPAPQSQHPDQTVSDDDVCDFLAEPPSHPQSPRRVSMPEQFSAASVTAAAVKSSPAVTRAKTPGTPSQSATVARSRVPTRLLATAATIVVAFVCWFTASQFRQNGLQEFAGSIRFEGPAPPAAFIQLLRLNSPREEDFVTEIRDGQFAFPNVPPGDYALWLAAADGKPIPCRPVGSSVGLLTEAEHHLRITLSHSSGPFAFQFVTVLEN